MGFVAENMTVNNASKNELISDAVVGLGLTGLSVVRYLMSQGIKPVVFDSRENPPGVEQLKQEFSEIQTYFGAFDQDKLARVERLIVSPGISVKTPAISFAKAQGAEVIGDIELFAKVADKPVIAITGSNGKSTVTTLVGEIFNKAGLSAGVGGNIGVPALELLNKGHDVYVLELSSFQLETTFSLKPQAAVVLNVSEDHLDRYDSMQHYILAKEKIYQHAQLAVINRDDPVVATMHGPQQETGFTLGEPQDNDFGLCHEAGVTWLCHGQQKLLMTNELFIGGLHNAANVLAALALCENFDLERQNVLQAVREFAGLPHRTQCVASSNGIKWYNDSKATNVGATQAALEGLGHNIILIAGGESKDADLSPLRTPVAEKTKAVILIGRDAPLIQKVCEGVTEIYHASCMYDAVLKAKDIAVAGDTVLLSPACASFDMFNNYMHRGEVFSDAVKAVLS